MVINIFNKLNKNILSCNKCNNISPNRGLGYGNIESRVMIIAQNPGWQPLSKSEDIIPFGLDKGGENSGKYLVKLLKELEIKDFYLTNIIKCPTLNNRPPTKEEINNCIIKLNIEIRLQKPKIVLLLGKIAEKEFSRIQYTGADKIISCWHPGYISRNPRMYDKWKERILEKW